MSSSFDVRMKCYDVSYKRLKCNFIRFKKTLQENPSLNQCCSAIRLISNMAKTISLQQSSLRSERNKTCIRQAELRDKIASKRKTAKICRRKSRKKKECQSTRLDSKLFQTSSNYRYSFYFHSSSNHYEYENVDYLKFLVNRHHFFGRISCEHPPWTAVDSRKLQYGIRECIRQKYLTIERECKLNPVSDDDQTTERYDRVENFIQNFDRYNYEELVLRAELADEDYDWKFISSVYLGGKHTAKEIENVWHLIAKPSISCKCWSTEEDMLLRGIVVECRFQNWAKICSRLQTGRTEFQCFVRYQRHLKPSTRNIPDRWSNKQDAQIEESDENLSVHRVTNVRTIFGRTNISIEKSGKTTRRFSYREKCLIHSYASRGYSFDLIAQLLGSGRNRHQIRAFYTASTSKTKHGTWHPDEIRRLLKCIKYIGEGRWINISKCMAGRSPTQCCHKYHLLHLKRKRYVQSFLERISSDRVKEIHCLLRIRSPGEKLTKRRQKTIDQRIEQYFLEQLAQRSIGLAMSSTSKILCIKHSLSLLKFLNFNVSSTLINFDMLYNCLEKHSFTNETYETLYAHLKTPATFDCKILNIRMNSTFAKIVPKLYNVLPPNKCFIYGFNKFMENYKSFVRANDATDINALWQRLNSTHKCDKEFVQAKILWYNILKAMFFWPIKLQSLLPEELPK